METCQKVLYLVVFFIEFVYFLKCFPVSRHVLLHVVPGTRYVLYSMPKSKMYPGIPRYFYFYFFTFTTVTTLNFSYY